MSTATAIRETMEPELEFGVVDQGDPDGPPLVRIDESREGRDGDEGVDEAFSVLADQLEGAAAGLSSTRRAMSHPAFMGILALGKAAIPGSIERLKCSHNRPLWLRVLGSLTPFPPGAGQSTIDQAALAWMRWGDREGFSS
jgi:hypothetical protein